MIALLSDEMRGSIVALLIPENFRRQARLLAEEACKIIGVIKTQGIGYFTDGQRGIPQFVFGEHHHVVLNVVEGRFTGKMLDQIPEIVGREIAALCEIGNRGQPGYAFIFAEVLF